MSEPPITIQAAHQSGSNGKINRIVIHATSPGMNGHSASAPGMARNTANYFKSASSGGSAHYITDSGGAEEHCVKDNKVAWHAPPNSNSIGIEICGDSTYARGDWLAGDVWPGVVKAAERTQELCDRHGVPKVDLTVSQLANGGRGVVTHKQVSDAFKQTDHWDPGPGFPMDRFMEIVLGGQAGGDEGGWYDDMADNDIVGEVKVSDRAFYQLQKDGGVRAVGSDRQGIDNEPFANYYIVANTGQAYYFGQARNGGVFSYLGLPADSRQGSRFFTSIHLG